MAWLIHHAATPRVHDEALDDLVDDITNHAAADLGNAGEQPEIEAPPLNSGGRSRTA